MKRQGGAALSYAQSPDLNQKLALVFGEDEGVVGDTAGALIRAWQAIGPSSVRTLDEDDVRRTPEMLFDALEARSLLGEQTILRLRTSGDKLAPILKDVLALAAEGSDRLAAFLVVMSGPLKVRSKIRTAFESAPGVAALHVFADSATDIAERVGAFLDQNGLQIAPDALSVFVGGLPGHRSLANAEMEKLALYGMGLGRPISIADIRALCETNADESSRAAIFQALAGQVDTAQAELDRVMDAGGSPIGLLRQFELEAARMLTAHALRRGGEGNVGMKLKPPVFQSDWPAFEQRLRKWPVPRLLRLMERIHGLEAAAKSPGGGGLAEAATKALFLALAKAAA
jgi:DNA polymerase-3 subunit delta